MVFRAILALGAALVLLPHHPDIGVMPDGSKTKIGIYITEAEGLLKARFAQAVENLREQKSEITRLREQSL